MKAWRCLSICPSINACDSHVLPACPAAEDEGLVLEAALSAAPVAREKNRSRAVTSRRQFITAAADQHVEPTPMSGSARMYLSGNEGDLQTQDKMSLGLKTLRKSTFSDYILSPRRPCWISFHKMNFKL